MELLVRCFKDTFSNEPGPRRTAEAELSMFAAEDPNYSLKLLHLVAEPYLEEQIRLAAAINFKNYVGSRWAPPPEHWIKPIPYVEKEKIKSLTPSLMLSAPRRIQFQLCEALYLIGKYGCPQSWAGLLPHLSSVLRHSNDYNSIHGILYTANSLFKKFRYRWDTKDVALELGYFLDHFSEPLLRVFRKTGQLIEMMVASAGDSHMLKALFECQILCSKIFYSLNFQALPEFFEDHLKEWMFEFQKYLSRDYPALESHAAGLEIADSLRVAICINISHYMAKYEVEFADYIAPFALTVWNLFWKISRSSGRDKLVVAAMKTLLTTVGTRVQFASQEVIKIFEGIVIPNVRLRDEEERLFKMNYEEFIRRDLWGIDIDTRRKTAIELLKGIAKRYMEEVIKVVSFEIHKLMAAYTANPALNWRDKYCAISLIAIFATVKSGGFPVATDNVLQLLVPELQSLDVNSLPMLKAGVLKFFIIIRNQIPKDIGYQLFPVFIRFLSAESNVVHSYASICIEKFFLIKDEGGHLRYDSIDLAPFMQVITNLFNASKFPKSINRVMKCINRVLAVADISPEIAAPCFARLSSILNEVCKNPKNRKSPIFNRLLFESVAIVVRRTCHRDASLLPTFEYNLLPSLQIILENNVAELSPGAFQLLAQLVELNLPANCCKYMRIFTLQLVPAEKWKSKANVPGLLRFLQAFLQKAPYELSQEGKLGEILGMFQKLVQSRCTQDQGFYVLKIIIESLEYGVISSYMHRFWSVLFNRLQRGANIKFMKSVLICMALFLVKHSVKDLVNTINSVQPNIFPVIIENFWIPYIKEITGYIEIKIVAVASTKLICDESKLLLDVASDHKLRGKMLDGIVTLFSQSDVGYTAKSKDDPLTSIKDPKEYFVVSVTKRSADFPGIYPSIIANHLDVRNQIALLKLCHSYEVRID